MTHHSSSTGGSSIGRSLIVAIAVALTLLVAGCSDNQTIINQDPVTSSSPAEAEASGSAPTSDTLYPDVVKVEISGNRDTLSFAVTMTSPYDSPERYADGMRVRSVDGKTVYGERTLTHDHASEQPFTRSVDGVTIPSGVSEVVVEGRDQVSGWGGATQQVEVPQ